MEILSIENLIDNKKCYETIRELRWGENGVICPHCNSAEIIKRGKDDQNKHNQRYECNSCSKRFDDTTGTIFSGRHQPLKIWILFLYFMGLNLSTSQIAKELNLNKDDAQKMAITLREGIVDKKEDTKLSGKVECDEVYIVAGHKGNASAVKKRKEKAGEEG